MYELITCSQQGLNTCCTCTVTVYIQ